MKIDIREKQDRISLAKRFFPKADIEQLDVGDYIEGNLGVEWKEDDFIDSIKGRMFPQVAELTGKFKTPVMIIAKPFKEVRKDMMKPHWPNPYAGFNGVVASLIVRGVSPIFVDKPEYGFELIEALRNKANDTKNRSVLTSIRPRTMPKLLIDSPTVPGFKDRDGKHTPTYADYQLNILMGFPRMSTIKASAVLEHFGSLDNFFNATIEEIQEVKGIKNLATIWKDLMKWIRPKQGEVQEEIEEPKIEELIDIDMDDW